MPEAVPTVEPSGWPAERAAPSTTMAPVLRIALCYTLVPAAFVIVHHVLKATDYVAAGNDDWMRLVEVRDLLAGQNWFDMHQYRLGPPGGTLMHWSRFVDLPIAALIAFFSLFLREQAAEAVALSIWPVVTLLPLLTGMALGGWRLAGRSGAHFAAGLTALYVICVGRFSPGSIDHDNVQMALMALSTAMLIDRRYESRSFAIAGFLCGAAIAIGAETTPYVAVMCAAAAGLWAWEGQAMAGAARAFGLSLAATLTACFYATTPPSLYSTVQCDSLSVGFYVLGTIGGGLLFAVAASTLSKRSRPERLAALAGCGAIIAACVTLVAPQCLRGPYADLDPLLVRLWLDHISEAQPMLAVFRQGPFTASAFYAGSVLAIVACLWQIARGKNRQTHVILLALVAVSFGVTAAQVRGSLFSTLFATFPLAAAIAEIRGLHRIDPRNLKLTGLYVVLTLASSAPVWAFGGSLLEFAAGSEVAQTNAAGAAGHADCRGEAAMKPLQGLAPGLIAGPSNMGVGVLRYSSQRVLAAPYHRDAAGLTAALRIEMAPPAEAEAMLRDSHVTLFAYCANDPETSIVGDAAPEGLLADVSRGNVPSYLSLLPASAGGPVLFYRVMPATN